MEATGQLLEKLTRVDWSRLRAHYVTLFGSSLYKTRPRDIDLAIRYAVEPSLDLVLDTMRAVADATGYPDDHIDIVVLNWWWRYPCELVIEALAGTPVYVANLNEYAAEVSRRVMICYDILLSHRKLQLLDTILEVVKSRWES